MKVRAKTMASARAGTKTKAKGTTRARGRTKAWARARARPKAKAKATAKDKTSAKAKCCGAFRAACLQCAAGLRALPVILRCDLSAGLWLMCFLFELDVLCCLCHG